jgi:hypothetical protein
MPAYAAVPAKAEVFASVISQRIVIPVFAGMTARFGMESA